MPRTAHAFWITRPGLGQIQPVTLSEPAADEVVVRTVYSAVSRGSEGLVFHGEVPANQRALMRAPFQDGEFPGPVKYGYLNVGIVEQGPPPWPGRVVFCLYPHQTRYVVPTHAVTPVPADVPAERAVLAGTMETIVNACWDALPMLGDRITVIGAGMVGCCAARVLTRFPGVEVQLVDPDASRAPVAEALGVALVHPDRAAPHRDLVVHASSSEAGLARALELLMSDGTVVELSWYGDRAVHVPLGEFFHSRRLVLRGSQVSTVSPNKPHRGTEDRLALALEMLRDPAFDALFGTDVPFAALPAALPRITAGQPAAPCQRIAYGPHDEDVIAEM